MRRILLLLSFLTVIGCSRGKSEKYIFYSNPSFFRGFTLELDETKEEISIYVPADFFVSDTISKINFRVLDSIEFEGIKKLLPQDSKFKYQLSPGDFSAIQNNLQLLSQIKLDEKDMIPPTDGITIAIEKYTNSNKVVNVFYSPRKDSKQGKIISAVYSQLEIIATENNLVENAVENSRRYFEDVVIEIKSTDPLYVKVLEEDCEELETQLKKLPEAKKIYLDITNLRSFRDNCLEAIFRKKYSKICLIGNEAFYDN